MIKTVFHCRRTQYLLVNNYSYLLAYCVIWETPINFPFCSERSKGLHCIILTTLLICYVFTPDENVAK